MSHALAIITLTHCIVLLPLCIAVLLPLASLLLIRLRVFSTIRVDVLDKSRHELSHIIAVVLKPPQLLFEGKEPTILLQHQDD